MADIAAIAARYEALKTLLDERSRRLLAAAESQAVGKGGISVVAKATGISRPVIRQGIADLKDPTALASGRVRKEGGGRKRVIDKDASLKTDLAVIVGIHHARRPAGSATLDLQERTSVDRRAEANGPPSQSSGGSRSAA